jgi:hypothetical protein
MHTLPQLNAGGSLKSIMSNLQMVFVGVASALILFWLVVAIRGPRKIEEPGVLAVLRYGAALRIFALVLAWGAPAIVVYVVVNFSPRNPDTQLAVGIGLLVLSAIPGLLLLEVERMQIAITEDAIVRHSPWTGTCVVKWADVTRVSDSKINRWFVVNSTGGTIRVSQHLKDIGAFVRIARRKLSAERYSAAAAAFDACS